MPQSPQAVSPRRQPSGGPSGGLQLITLVALLASTRTFAVDLRTVDHLGVAALVLVLLQYPRANPCAMPGLGYTQGGPDRAASITEFHNRHSQDFKVPMASSVSVSHRLNRSEASSSLDGLLSSRPPWKRL